MELIDHESALQYTKSYEAIKCTCTLYISNIALFAACGVHIINYGSNPQTSSFLFRGMFLAFSTTTAGYVHLLLPPFYFTLLLHTFFDFFFFYFVYFSLSCWLYSKFVDQWSPLPSCALCFPSSSHRTKRNKNQHRRHRHYNVET